MLLDVELSYDIMFMKPLEINELIHVYDPYQFNCNIAYLVVESSKTKAVDVTVLLIN